MLKNGTFTPSSTDAAMILFGEHGTRGNESKVNERYGARKAGWSTKGDEIWQQYYA